MMQSGGGEECVDDRDALPPPNRQPLMISRGSTVTVVPSWRTTCTA